MKTKKIFALVLALVVLLTCLGVTAFAATDDCPTCGGDGLTGQQNDATCTDCFGTGKIAYLDAATDTKIIEQKYDVTVTNTYADVNKVQVSWTVPDITASVTINKIWDPDTLQWIADTNNDNTASAEAVPAEFDFINLSSKRLKGKVDFTASGDFDPTINYSDKVVALLSKADDATCDNKAKIIVTLMPGEDDFTSITSSTSGIYGTYTVSIAEPEYLTFTAAEAGSTVTPNFANGTWEYSTDNGSTWTAGTNDGNTAIALAQVNDFVELRGDGCTTGYDEQENPHFFSMSGKIAASGDVTSITNGVGDDAKLSDYCYLCMFQDCTSLVEAPKLPATTLSDCCYWSMFQGCTSLTEAPKLPATTLKNSCYSGMFQYCTSLEDAPKLLSTTLANDCYAFMFLGCASLKEAPELPATEMFSCCYANMFAFCTSLTQAPVLPATTLNESCYSQMFQGCTSLTTATILPATELAVGCYCYMFNGCTSLKVQVGGSAPANGGLIFVCPSNVEGSNYMFGGTDVCDDYKGTFDEDDQLWYADFDITEGTAYYWYIEN